MEMTSDVMCPSMECPKRHKCHRSPFSGRKPATVQDWQCPDKEDGTCAHFIPKPGQRRKMAIAA